MDTAIEEIPSEALVKRCQLEGLGFGSTEELPDLQDVIGQPRALRALEPAPDDWCYVKNCENPRVPRAIRLPAVRGAAGALSINNCYSRYL